MISPFKTPGCPVATLGLLAGGAGAASMTDLLRPVQGVETRIPKR